METASKVVTEKTCVRRIRFSTSCESTAQNDDSIKVYARLKPSPDPQERTFRTGSTSVKYSDTDKRGNEKIVKFMFHKAFAGNVDQDELFRLTMDHDIDRFIEGANRLLFTYGTTGSGKTYTLLGNDSNPGLLPRSTAKLFLTLQDYLQETRLCPDQGCDVRTLTDDEFNGVISLRDNITTVIEDCEGKMPQQIDGFGFGKEDVVGLLTEVCKTVKEAKPSFVDDTAVYSVWVSYAEVYNEKVYNLFEPLLDSKPLKFGQDSNKDYYVKGLGHVLVTTWMDMWKLFLYGRSRLHVSSTRLNKSSSRSHSVFTLKLLKLKDKKYTVNSLTLCDLAGNERQKKTLNQGQALTESKSINTSLMNLNKCFRVVRENKATGQNVKPPYRESKLTMMFQKAFSYCEPITMIVNLCQNPSLLDESKNTLKMSAVAQETVKPLKQVDRFLKPGSRFSVICADPSLPVFSQPSVSGESGIMLLGSSSTASSHCHWADDELVMGYETKIRSLEEEIKTKNEEKKTLLEMVEDARSEYLNLKKKYQDSEAENEIVIEDLETNLEDLETNLEELEWRYNAVVDNQRQIDNCYNETKLELETVKKSLAECEARNRELEARLEKMEQQQQKESAKKGRRQLLSVIDLVEEDESGPQPDTSGREGLSPVVPHSFNPLANSTEQDTEEKKSLRPVRRCRK